ncbi:hypothetical protein PQX77_019696 [Marasmius sp. AFHP31]|nr:hypothetical protein PQX77_019696 [Marasmius sp. AFHP31]
MSDFFPNGRNFKVAGDSFNHVAGSQNNYNGPTTIIRKRSNAQRTEFDDFRNVRRGDICRLRNIQVDRNSTQWDENDMRSREECHQPRDDRIISQNDCNDSTTIIQEQSNALQTEFDDFRNIKRGAICRLRDRNSTQWDENDIRSREEKLVPIVHFLRNNGLSAIYIANLDIQLGCDENRLWIDAGRGLICRGPPGPWISVENWDLQIKDLPLTSELLREDVMLRFLASLKLREADCAVVVGVNYFSRATVVPRGVSQPTVISTLTNTPIAVANNLWESKSDNPTGPSLLENGLFRFTLNGGSGFYLCLRWNWNSEKAWMSQAWSVFHARGITSEEDLSAYNLYYSDAQLHGHIKVSEDHSLDPNQFTSLSGHHLLT